MYWAEASYPGFWLKYKMFKRNSVFGECSVDLELPGRASEIERLQRDHAAELAALGATVVRTGNSAAVRIEVPRIVPPVFEEEPARAALRAAESLLLWCARNSLLTRDRRTQATRATSKRHHEKAKGWTGATPPRVS